MTLVVQASESSVMWTVQMSRSGPLGCLDGNPAFLPKLVPSHHPELLKDKQTIDPRDICELLDCLETCRGQYYCVTGNYTHGKIWLVVH